MLAMINDNNKIFVIYAFITYNQKINILEAKMKTDIQIAQECKLKRIEEIAKKLNLKDEYYEVYGKYKAKIELSLLNKLKNKKDGKLILVTAITPTPAGEGKSTVTIGLTQGLNKIGKKTIAALREPSLGPVF